MELRFSLSWSGRQGGSDRPTFTYNISLDDDSKTL